MHQHHTIVRAPQGKVTKISNDQYHDSMDIDEIEPIARQRTVVAQEFKLVNCNGNTRLVRGESGRGEALSGSFLGREGPQKSTPYPGFKFEFKKTHLKSKNAT